MKFHVAALFASAVAVHGVEGANLYDAIKQLPNTQTFMSLLDASGLQKTLQSTTNEYTVFVPTDLTFDNWPQYKVNYLLKEPGAALQYAQYTIHQGKLTTSNMTAWQAVKTLNPLKSLTVTDVDGDSVHLQDATCGAGQSLEANLPADNGVFHLVDTVFLAPGSICPDKIFVAEQRTEARISSYGYDCRAANETRHLYTTNSQKPVGLATDDIEETVFWANDQDYPRRSPTSWISKVFYNESGQATVNDKLIDPQGIYADTANKDLYFASHSGFGVYKMNYDGSNVSLIYEQNNNLNFQPSDVVVDVDAGLMFTSVEGTSSDAGSLWQVNLDGTNATQLLPSKAQPAGLIQNYGLCIDKYAKHIFWVQGGNGGSIHCLPYGTTPCQDETVVTDLQYPYMCDVDNAFAPYGGPTRIAWSEANRPGSVKYAFVNGSDPSSVNVTVSTDLDAPMGIQFGCSQF